MHICWQCSKANVILEKTYYLYLLIQTEYINIIIFLKCNETPIRYLRFTELINLLIKIHHMGLKSCLIMLTLLNNEVTIAFHKSIISFLLHQILCPIHRNISIKSIFLSCIIDKTMKIFGTSIG